MTIASRFSVAVHILMLVGTEPDPTSEWMARSIGVNSVTVRMVVGRLRRAGLVRTRQGAAGARLARPLTEITLLDVYRAVQDQTDLFSIHTHPSPDCPIGAHIQASLESILLSAQQALEQRLAATSLQQALDDVLHRRPHGQRQALQATLDATTPAQSAQSQEEMR